MGGLGSRLLYEVIFTIISLFQFQSRYCILSAIYEILGKRYGRGQGYGRVGSTITLYLKYIHLSSPFPPFFWPTGGGRWGGGNGVELRGYSLCDSSYLWRSRSLWNLQCILCYTALAILGLASLTRDAVQVEYSTNYTANHVFGLTVPFGSDGFSEKAMS